MRKTLHLSSLLVLVLFTLQAQADIKPPETHFFMDTFGDYQEELSNAREQGKKGIMVFFEMDDCPFCHRMKTTILNQTDVQKYYRDNFLVFTLDIEGDIEMTDFQGETISQKDFAFKKTRVRATPVIAFYDLDGKIATRYTGATRDTKEFLLLGKFVVEGHYKKTNFTRFKRENR